MQKSLTSAENVQIIIPTEFSHEISEIILFTNNTESRYKSIVNHMGHFKNPKNSYEFMLDKMIGIVNQSVVEYHKEISKDLKLAPSERRVAAQILLKEYLAEIELGNY